MAGGSFLADYEPVAVRIARFWNDHPAGKITTEVVSETETAVTFRCEIWRSPDGGMPDATGHAREEVSQSGVNRSSSLENAETSAVGRALANLGYSPKRPRQRST